MAATKRTASRGLFSFKNVRWKVQFCRIYLPIILADSPSIGSNTHILRWPRLSLHPPAYKTRIIGKTDRAGDMYLFNWTCSVRLRDSASHTCESSGVRSKMIPVFFEFFSDKMLVSLTKCVSLNTCDRSESKWMTFSSSIFRLNSIQSTFFSAINTSHTVSGYSKFTRHDCERSKIFKVKTVRWLAENKSYSNLFQCQVFNGSEEQHRRQQITNDCRFHG